eukprot:scaffold5542_cov79-Skeletonema_marinoi.AAC.3
MKMQMLLTLPLHYCPYMESSHPSQPNELEGDISSPKKRKGGWGGNECQWFVESNEYEFHFSSIEIEPRQSTRRNPTDIDMNWSTILRLQ